MNEFEFTQAAALVFARVENSLDDGDIECSIIEGVMELEFDDGSKIIVSRHLPNREIWLAARNGGFHFRLQEGVWRDTRDQGELFARLSQCVAAHGGQVDWV